MSSSRFASASIAGVLVFTMSSSGYVKVVSATEFRTQSRGGRGVAGANLKDEDTVVNMIHTSAHAYLLFFSNRGKVYRLKAHQLPMASRTARGTHLSNLLPLEPEEFIEAVIDTRDYETNRYLFFATRQGRVKKTLFNAYDSSLKAGLIAIRLNDGDELVEVTPANEDDDIFLVSRSGQTIRFSESQVRAMGRTAAGVKGMRFRDDDELVSCAVGGAGATLVHVTSAGYGKRSEPDEFARKGRGGLGVRGIRTRDERGVVVGAFFATDDDEILLIGDGGSVIRMPAIDISLQGRSASGVRIMNVQEGRQIAAASRVPPSDDDDELEELADGEAEIQTSHDDADSRSVDAVADDTEDDVPDED
jgi:DNA gyrase subunit A